MFQEIKTRLVKVNCFFLKGFQKNKYEMSLTEEQGICVSRFLETKRDVLVDAGPGTGKTFTMVALVKEWIRRGGKPEGIFILCYNKSLAREYEAEFQEIESVGSLGALGTMDSFARRLLTGRRSESPDYTKMAVAHPGAVRWPSKELVDLILVDEYQDLTETHLRFLEAFGRSSPQARWFAAGDIRQTLYRDGGLAIPLSFRQLRPWDMLSLTLSMRCARKIAEFASAIFLEFPWAEQESEEFMALRSLYEEPLRSGTGEEGVVRFWTFRTQRLARNQPLFNQFAESLQRIKKDETVLIATTAARGGKSGELITSLEHFIAQRGFDVHLHKAGSSLTPAPGQVDIRTVHGAKGLTFDHVFLLNCFETPDLATKYAYDAYSLDSRMKLFVGGTRARTSLTIINNGTKRGTKALWVERAVRLGLRPRPLPPQPVPEHGRPYPIGVTDLLRRIRRQIPPPGKIHLLTAGLELEDEPFVEINSVPAFQKTIQASNVLYMAYGRMAEAALAARLELPIQVPQFVSETEHRSFTRFGVWSPEVQERYPEGLLTPKVVANWVLNEHVHESQERIQALKGKQIETNEHEFWQLARFWAPSKLFLSHYGRLAKVPPAVPWLRVHEQFQRLSPSQKKLSWQFHLQPLELLYQKQNYRLLGVPDLLFGQDEIWELKYLARPSGLRQNQHRAWSQLALYGFLYLRQKPQLRKIKAKVFCLTDGSLWGVEWSRADLEHWFGELGIAVLDSQTESDDDEDGQPPKKRQRCLTQQKMTSLFFFPSAVPTKKKS